jgi:hypothetical protein
MNNLLAAANLLAPSYELCGLACIHEAKGENWTISDKNIDEYMRLAE